MYLSHYLKRFYFREYNTTASLCTEAFQIFISSLITAMGVQTTYTAVQTSSNRDKREKKSIIPYFKDRYISVHNLFFYITEVSTSYLVSHGLWLFLTNVIYICEK